MVASDEADPEDNTQADPVLGCTFAFFHSGQFATLFSSLILWHHRLDTQHVPQHSQKLY